MNSPQYTYSMLACVRAAFADPDMSAAGYEFGFAAGPLDAIDYIPAGGTVQRTGRACDLCVGREAGAR